METKILGIKQIVWDKEIYPRAQYNWHNAYVYSQAMNSGAVFPNIIVALVNGQYYLVDGKHRLEALRMNKQEFATCNIIGAKSLDEVYIQAIKYNISHGQQLSPYEKAVIAMKLQKMNVSNENISQIIQVPLGKLQDFVAKKMTNTVTGEEFILKAPNGNLAGVVVNDATMQAQSSYSSQSQRQIVHQLVLLLQNDSINMKDAFLVEDLKLLHSLIAKAVLSRRKK